MKNIITYSLSLILFLLSTTFISGKKSAVGYSKNIYVIKDASIDEIMHVHRKLVAQFYTSTFLKINQFDRGFFQFAHLNNNPLSQNFLKNISMLAKSGHRQVFYSSSISQYTNINGKVTVIKYNLNCDGFKVRLSKSTFYEGKTLESIYNFNIKNRTLKIIDKKNKKIIFDKTYPVI